jgi:hypothetical protein
MDYSEWYFDQIDNVTEILEGYEAHNNNLNKGVSNAISEISCRTKKPTHTIFSDFNDSVENEGNF